MHRMKCLIGYQYTVWNQLAWYKSTSLRQYDGRQNQLKSIGEDLFYNLVKNIAKTYGPKIIHTMSMLFFGNQNQISEINLFNAS